MPFFKFALLFMIFYLLYFSRCFRFTIVFMIFFPIYSTFHYCYPIFSTFHYFIRFSLHFMMSDCFTFHDCFQTYFTSPHFFSDLLFMIFPTVLFVIFFTVTVLLIISSLTGAFLFKNANSFSITLLLRLLLYFSCYCEQTESKIFFYFARPPATPEFLYIHIFMET